LHGLEVVVAAAVVVVRLRRRALAQAVVAGRKLDGDHRQKRHHNEKIAVAVYLA